MNQILLYSGIGAGGNSVTADTFVYIQNHIGFVKQRAGVVFLESCRNP
jgi:hypothetical protein